MTNCIEWVEQGGFRLTQNGSEQNQELKDSVSRENQRKCCIVRKDFFSVRGSGGASLTGGLFL